MAEKETKHATFDSKAMIEKHAKAETIIRYSDRVQVEIIKSTKHYHIGQLINPHKIMGEELIAQGIAKAYEPKKAK